MSRLDDALRDERHKTPMGENYGAWYERHGFTIEEVDDVLLTLMREYFGVEVVLPDAELQVYIAYFMAGVICGRTVPAPPSKDHLTTLDIYDDDEKEESWWQAFCSCGWKITELESEEMADNAAKAHRDYPGTITGLFGLLPRPSHLRLHIPAPGPPELEATNRPDNVPGGDSAIAAIQHMTRELLGGQAHTDEEE